MSMDKRVLIVDDSATWRRFHLATIKTYFPKGFVCQEADSARAGLKLINDNLNEPFDIIISDLQMEFDFEPETAGEWFVKQVKGVSAYKNTKIILISAMFNIEHIANSLDVEYLKKSTLANNNLTLRLKLEELCS